MYIWVYRKGSTEKDRQTKHRQTKDRQTKEIQTKHRQGQRIDSYKGSTDKGSTATKRRQRQGTPKRRFGVPRRFGVSVNFWSRLIFMRPIFWVSPACGRTGPPAPANPTGNPNFNPQNRSW
jgi:hypothetical protein